MYGRRSVVNTGKLADQESRRHAAIRPATNLWRRTRVDLSEPSVPDMPPPMPGQEEDDHDESDDDSSDSSEEGPAGECEDDRCGGPALPIWHCVDCDSSYCRYGRFRLCTIGILTTHVWQRLLATARTAQTEEEREGQYSSPED